jgi:hypothetical protein
MFYGSKHALGVNDSTWEAIVASYATITILSAYVVLMSTFCDER